MRDFTVHHAGPLLLAWTLVLEGQLAEIKETMFRLEPSMVVMAPFQPGRATITCRPPPGVMHRHCTRIVIERLLSARASRRSLTFPLVDCRRTQMGSACSVTVGGVIAGTWRGGLLQGFVLLTLTKLRVEQAGVYRCMTFSAPKGTVYYQYAKLSIQDVPTWVEYNVDSALHRVMKVTCNATFDWPGPKVVWTWESQRDVEEQWRPLPHDETAEFMVGTRRSSTDSSTICISSLAVRLSSYFVHESFRCRLCLEKDDAGRSISVFKVVHSRLKVRKARQARRNETSGYGGEDVAHEDDDADEMQMDIVMIVLGVSALVLVVVLVIVIYCIYMRMIRMEKAKELRRAQIRSRAKEASARLREELEEDMSRTGSVTESETESQSHRSLSSFDRQPKVSVHFSDSDTVWDPYTGMYVYRHGDRDSSRVERISLDGVQSPARRWSPNSRDMGYGSRRSSRDIVNEYRTRRHHGGGGGSDYPSRRLSRTDSVGSRASASSREGRRRRRNQQESHGRERRRRRRGSGSEERVSEAGSSDLAERYERESLRRSRRKRRRPSVSDSVSVVSEESNPLSMVSLDESSVKDDDDDDRSVAPEPDDKKKVSRRQSTSRSASYSSVSDADFVELRAALSGVSGVEAEDDTSVTSFDNHTNNAPVLSASHRQS